MDYNNKMLVENNKSEIELITEKLTYVREDLKDNPYLIEGIRVLPVGGFRSAIGCFWNAVVDDLRNKIIYRGLHFFNKEMNLNREIKTYEDFQDFVNDDQLLEGAYKIGVIGWEAHKVLKQAKETRHIFDGHPRSSDPSPVKVLSMMEDCVKYVLSQEYPMQIINIDEYLKVMETEQFNRNEYAVSDAMGDLPYKYQKELINRLFTAYCNQETTAIFKSNIEFVSPYLWRNLPSEDIKQVALRIDNEIRKGNSSVVESAFKFIEIVDGKMNLSYSARKYYLAPIIEELNNNLDQWQIENKCIHKLKEYAGYIPRELINDYVNGITQSYVGYNGGSMYFARTDFYANGASFDVPEMFNKFDDESVTAFIKCIKNNEILKGRIRSNNKLNRLRTLANIAYKRTSEKFNEKDFLENLIDEKKEEKFFKLID